MWTGNVEETREAVALVRETGTHHLLPVSLGARCRVWPNLGRRLKAGWRPAFDDHKQVGLACRPVCHFTW